VDERSGQVTIPLIHAAEIALGRQRSPEHEQGDHLVQYLRSANITDGSLSLDDVKTMNFTPREQSLFGLRTGDVLVTEGSGSRNMVGTSAVWRGELPDPICFQNTLLRLRPRLGVTDGRYLAWWARHAHSAGMMANAAAGANILHLSSENARRLPFPIVGLAEQRRIADFLDAQVARIDNIITARTLQLGLVAGMRVNVATQLLASLADRDGPPLSAVATIVDTEHKTAPDAADGSYWSAGTGAIRRGVIQHDALRRIDGRTYHEWTRRAVPRAGDVLLTREAPVGEVALLAKTDPPIAIGQRVVLLRPSDGIEPEFLRLVLMSSALEKVISDSTQGSLHPHLNMADIARIRVPNPTPQVQQSFGFEYSDALHEISVRNADLDCSINLLNELKRSLITSAVSGEFDVSSADGLRVPV
jgi:type I restriction enzyme S subunit